MNNMQKNDQGEYFIPELGVGKSESFSALYPVINQYMMYSLDNDKSRAGDVKEILDFKTQITDPYKRCVGGWKRDINIFFLLAEAMWITLGRKDVEFLTFFNKNMAQFSDNGETFHAPYGFRLRHWGVHSETSSQGDLVGFDQVTSALRLLYDNPNTRQVVMSIWNPSFDLGVTTKDIPCNDMVMLKIRKGKLITTIQNRSNDLHWGLPTNVFQFSFLTEIMSACLGIELGTQTHNSQSLHIYQWNDTAKIMADEFENADQYSELYGDLVQAKTFKMDFKFENEVPTLRLRDVDSVLRIIIDNLTLIAEGKEDSPGEVNLIKDFSSYLHTVYQLLKIFLNYKKELPFAKTNEQKDLTRLASIKQIEILESVSGFDSKWDVFILAKNFFASRIKNVLPENNELIGKL